MAGSVAVDAGDDCVVQDQGCLTSPLSTDQRGTGFSRRSGAHIDIGAFELDTATPSPTPTPTLCPSVTLTPPSLANGTVGVIYNQTITASGGTAPYNFAVAFGALPAGLTLSSSGQLSGTPAAAGGFNFAVIVTDLNECSGNQDYSVSICESVVENEEKEGDGQLSPAMNHQRIS
jgi:hypothetical protein